MERFKKAAGKIFFLPYWLTLLIAVPSFLFVAYVLIRGIERSICAAAAYALSSYALILSGTAVYRIVKRIKERVTGHRLWKRYRRDLVFKTKLSLLPNTMITVFFVLLKMIAGFYYHSIWMISLGLYYFFLLLLRVFLLSNVYKHSMVIEPEKESKVTRSYGCILLLLDITLGGIVLYSVYRGAEYYYPGYLIYAMAAYTFYAVIAAAIGLYKNFRSESAVVITLNILRLTTALVALFALETAMLTAFGQDSSRIFRQYMITATGSVIVAIVFGMALYLILHFQLKKRKANFKG